MVGPVLFQIALASNTGLRDDEAEFPVWLRFDRVFPPPGVRVKVRSQAIPISGFEISGAVHVFTGPQFVSRWCVVWMFCGTLKSQTNHLLGTGKGRLYPYLTGIFGVEVAAAPGEVSIAKGFVD